MAWKSKVHSGMGAVRGVWGRRCMRTGRGVSSHLQGHSGQVCVCACVCLCVCVLCNPIMIYVLDTLSLPHTTLYKHPLTSHIHTHAHSHALMHTQTNTIVNPAPMTHAYIHP